MTPTDPTVRALVRAINSGDRDSFVAQLATGATMSDDGTDRDLDEWIDREIFQPHGRMEVLNESMGGRALIARFSNETWGEMRTAWKFDIGDDGKVTHFETGQA